MRADALFLLLTLGAVLGLAYLRTVVIPGHESVNRSPLLRPGAIFSILFGLMTAFYWRTSMATLQGTTSSRSPREFCYSAVPS